jgi:predicted ATP-grasp superfamily ATP-dependent carboligase
LKEGNRTDRPPVVVTGAYQTGVVLMRNLARRKIEVCCIDCVPNQPGFKTVYGKGYLCPNPDTEPAAWERFMIELARRIGRKPVLIASADQFVTAIADHAAALERHYIFRAASMVTQALLATKKRQYEIADKNGLPVPRTKYVQSIEELRQFGAEARFPCLLKPVHFREWQRFPNGHPLLNQKIVLARSPDEMEAKYRLAEAVTPAVVVQEVIEGPDDAKLVYLSCYGRSAKRLGSCIVRELRTYPIYFGSASVVEPIDDPETDALCDGFLRAVRYDGLCELELKRDIRDGRLKLIEANPRYSITADAAPYAGVDLGWLHYLDLIGEQVEPVKWNGRHFHHIVLRRDVACFRSYLDARLTTWGGLVKSYRSPVFFDFDLRDWRVTVETSVVLLKTLLYPTLRRFFPRTDVV